VEAVRCMTNLLADADWVTAMEALRRGFARQASDSNVPAVILALLGLCVFVVVLDQIYRLLQPRHRVRRVDYLARAGDVAGLSRGQVRDLRWVAGRAGLCCPAAMLLSPANLACAVNVALRGDPRPALRRRLERLSLDLFGVSLPAAGAVERARV
jgi:hypothetical protein